MTESNKPITRDLFLYVVIAYAFSWIFWLPQVLSSNRLLELPEFFVYIVGFVAPFGPLVAAFSVTYLKQGKEATKELLRRGADYRFGKRWLIPLFLLFPLWAGSALLVGWLTEGVTIDLPWFSNPLSLVFNFSIYNFVYMFFFVGVSEEFGWRGYALDRLQTRYSAVISSIMLGLIWGFWHLPLFFISGSPQQAAGLVPYLLQIVVFSIWLTWLYNNTGGSVLAAIIFHAMMDLTLLAIFPVTSIFAPSSLPVLYMYFSGLIILVAVIAIWGTKRMIREPKK